MKNWILSVFAIVTFSTSIVFAQETAAVKVSENAAGKASSVEAVPVAKASASVESANQNDSVEAELRQEIAIRDSAMALQNEACRVEKDSLRNAIGMEQAKSANWEQSYNTIKKNNEVCAQALSVSIGVNEKKKEKEDMDRKQAAMMTSTSFLGGLGLGMLLFWLIF